MANVLCGANAAIMKFYLNTDRYGRIPREVQKDLKKLCVLFCADVGGVLTMTFDDAHRLHLVTMQPIDEIGAELKIRQMQRENAELFRMLEEYDALLDRTDGFPVSAPAENGDRDSADSAGNGAALQETGGNGASDEA